MSTEIRLYAPKFEVKEAVLLDISNFNEVAEWCGATIEYRKVQNVDVPVLIITHEGRRESAIFGEYIFRNENEKHFRVMSPNTFEAVYRTW